jgi:hypothetical protein
MFLGSRSLGRLDVGDVFRLCSMLNMYESEEGVDKHKQTGSMITSLPCIRLGDQRQRKYIYRCVVQKNTSPNIHRQK